MHGARIRSSDLPPSGAEFVGRTGLQTASFHISQCEYLKQNLAFHHLRLCSVHDKRQFFVLQNDKSTVVGRRALHLYACKKAYDFCRNNNCFQIFQKRYQAALISVYASNNCKALFHKDSLFRDNRLDWGLLNFLRIDRRKCSRSVEKTPYSAKGLRAPALIPGARKRLCLLHRGPDFKGTRGARAGQRCPSRFGLSLLRRSCCGAAGVFWRWLRHIIDFFFYFWGSFLEGRDPMHVGHAPSTCSRQLGRLGFGGRCAPHLPLFP